MYGSIEGGPNVSVHIHCFLIAVPPTRSWDCDTVLAYSLPVFAYIETQVLDLPGPTSAGPMVILGYVWRRTWNAV